MLNKHPRKWTENECYEASFFARVGKQQLQLDSNVSGCFELMPKEFKEDSSLEHLRSQWIRGWADAS